MSSILKKQGNSTVSTVFIYIFLVAILVLMIIIYILLKRLTKGEIMQSEEEYGLMSAPTSSPCPSPTSSPCPSAPTCTGNKDQLITMPATPFSACNSYSCQSPTKDKAIADCNSGCAKGGNCTANLINNSYYACQPCTCNR